MYTKRQLLPANRVSQFYESNNESMTLSLSQIIKIIGKYISLCNSFTSSCIKFTFAMDPPWDGGHQPHTSLLLQLGCHGNQSKTSVTPLYGPY